MRRGDPFVPFFHVSGYGTIQHSLDFSASRAFRISEGKIIWAALAAALKLATL